MRTHPITGVVVSTALTTALIGGVLSATSASADASGHHTLVGQAAVPSAPADARTILAQAKALGGLGTVAAPVAKLVEDALAKQVSTDTVTKDADAVKASIDATKARFPAAPAAPVSPAAPGSATTLPAPLTGTMGMGMGVKALPRTNRDAVSDALASLQTAVNALLQTITHTLGGLLTAASGVVTGLIDTVAAILGSLGLPVALPAASTLPATPAM